MMVPNRNVVSSQSPPPSHRVSTGNFQYSWEPRVSMSSRYGTDWTNSRTNSAYCSLSSPEPSSISVSVILITTGSSGV